MIILSIIILGGCGEIGRYIAKDLVQQGVNITIADIRELEGKRLSKKLGSRADFSKLDIRDFDKLVEKLKDFKVVINNIGPYFEFGSYVPRAAIQAGINYVDICDDHDVTNELLNLKKIIERENLTFLINFGASPGLTNIMTKIGSEKFDHIDKLRILWYEDTGETIGLGQLMHWTHIAMGKVPVFINGSWSKLKALTQREVINFPDPCGSVPVFFVGHPEPVTLPRYINTKEAVCKGGILPESDVMLTKIIDKLVWIKNIKLIKLISTFFLKILPLLTGKVEDREIMSAFRSEIIGIKDQKEYHLLYTVIGQVAKLSGTPASIAAQMLLNGEINAPGIFPPEGCSELDLIKFEKELNNRGIYFIKTYK